MPTKRYNNLPKKTLELEADKIEKILKGNQIGRIRLKN